MHPLAILVTVELVINQGGDNVISTAVLGQGCFHTGPACLVRLDENELVGMRNDH
jgi:hypothetical protein